MLNSNEHLFSEARRCIYMSSLHKSTDRPRLCPSAVVTTRSASDQDDVYADEISRMMGDTVLESAEDSARHVGAVRFLGKHVSSHSERSRPAAATNFPVFAIAAFPFQTFRIAKCVKHR